MANTIVDKVKSALTGKTPKKSPEDVEAGLNQKFDRWWNLAESARKEIDWKWFKYDLWVNGNHYAKWDKNTQQIVSTPPKDGKPKVVINKTYSTLRGVRSYVLQNRPKAEVTPANLTKDTVDQANNLNMYLDYLHDRLHLRQSLRASMWHALKTSTGWWQVLFDDSKDDGNGEISVNVVDPYDLYWDPVARFPADARYAILAVRRNIQDLKEDPKYKDADWDGIKADDLLSSSSLKARLIQYEKGVMMGPSTKNTGEQDGTVIVKEYWYKESSEDEKEVEDMEAQVDDNGERPTKTVKTMTKKIMLCTKVGEKIIRKPFDTGLNRLPFFRLCSDIEPLSMYGNGWVKNIIPLNRLLEKNEGSAAEYNDIVNKGKYVEDKGAGTRTITSEHGLIIQKKRGFELTALPVPPLSPELGNQIQRVNMYIEDMGCLHDASLGRIPTGAKSGVSIEALQEGDSNNLSELVENTEEFLEDVYEYILYLASKKYQFARNIITPTTTGQKEFIKVIGEDASEDMKDTSATVIPSQSVVDVKITSWLAYTSEGRRQAIDQLAQSLQASGTPLDSQTILEAYEIGPIASIIKRMMEQQKQKQAQELQQGQQQAAAQTQQNLQQKQGEAQIQAANQPQPEQTPPGAGAQEAIAFIRMVVNGQKPQLPNNIDSSFIQYLDHFIQSSEAQSVGPQVLHVLQAARDQILLQMRNQTGRVTNSGSQ